MSYRVLARKYRPATLAEVEGQPQTVAALTNAFDQNRLHHAYMFSGTRGVGKTTLARIIAKCLNCETGVTSTPCLKCDNCLAINDGSFIDLVEVDGASRTKVEETRELLEDISYQATQGRYKIFIIDEVHALSDSSFQTLLKSLEEPPDHVKFVLATTNPDKVPVTVRSRCMHFHLHNISVETIQTHVSRVLSEEEIEIEEPAIHLLARMGRGSMRDALSLTDQAIAQCGSPVSEAAVLDMLGAAPLSEVASLLNLLATGERNEVFQAIEQLAMDGVDFAEVLAGLQTSVHALAMARATQSQPSEALKPLMDRCDEEWLQNTYQVLLMGGRDLQYAPEPRVGFEMTLLRLFDLVPLRMTEVPNASNEVAKDKGSKQSNNSVAQNEEVPPEPSPQLQGPARTQKPVEQRGNPRTFASGKPSEIPAKTEREQGEPRSSSSRSKSISSSPTHSKTGTQNSDQNAHNKEQFFGDDPDEVLETLEKEFSANMTVREIAPPKSEGD